LKSKVTILLVSLILLALIPAAVAAATIGVYVDGEKVVFPDQEPYIDSNSRVLVPLRGVFEKMGAKVDWEAPTKTVTADRAGTVVILKIGEKKALVNGETKTFDTQAVLRNGRTMVPLRFVSESLGATVQWISDKKEVRITTESDGSGNGTGTGEEETQPEEPSGAPDDLISKARPVDGEPFKMENYTIHYLFEEDFEDILIETVTVDDLRPNGIKFTERIVIHNVNVAPDAITMTLTSIGGLVPHIYLVEEGNVIRYHKGTSLMASGTDTVTKGTELIHGAELGSTTELPEPDLRNFKYIIIGFVEGNMLQIVNPIYTGGS